MASSWALGFMANSIDGIEVPLPRYPEDAWNYCLSGFHYCEEWEESYKCNLSIFFTDHDERDMLKLRPFLAAQGWKIEEMDKPDVVCGLHIDYPEKYYELLGYSNLQQAVFITQIIKYCLATPSEYPDIWPDARFWEKPFWSYDARRLGQASDSVFGNRGTKSLAVNAKTVDYDMQDVYMIMAGYSAIKYIITDLRDYANSIVCV